MSVSGVNSQASQMQVLVKVLMLGNRGDARAVADLLRQNLKGNTQIELVSEMAAENAAVNAPRLDVRV